MIVTFMSVTANLPQDFSLLSGVDRKYLLVGLLVVVTIALVRYSRLVLVAAVFILAAGANLPREIAETLNVDSRILLGSLIFIVLLSLANRVIKLPTGLDIPQGFPVEHGSIALFAAVSRRRAQTVRSLINSGANIDARSEAGLTPLMMAASEGHDEIVLLLKIKGADLNAVDAGGRTAVQLAMNAGHENTVAILKDKGVRATNTSNKVRSNTSNPIPA